MGRAHSPVGGARAHVDGVDPDDMSDITCNMPSVAIIDDDAAVRDLLLDCLELEGFTVQAAADGPAGLDLVAQMRPGCVVLDIMMPGLDGHAVLRQLRETYGYTIPVIMLTAAAGDEQTWQAWSGGVDYFLPKPFELDELIKKILALAANAESSFVPLAEPVLSLTVPVSADAA